MKPIILKPNKVDLNFEINFEGKSLLFKKDSSKTYYQDRINVAIENEQSACFLGYEGGLNPEVLVTNNVTVETLTRDNEDNIEVGFGNHPAILKLSTSSHDFDSYLGLLSNSLSYEKQILVSFKNGEIYNVRPVDGKSITLFPEKELYRFAPTNFRTAIDETELTNVFEFLMAEACTSNPTNIDYCITFQYVWDGCFARAHKMKQVMESNFNLTCEKVFNYGRLSVQAYQHCVTWGWHVAPVLTVMRTSGITEKLVVDPSIANYPLRVEEWRNMQLNACSGTPYLIGKADLVDGRCYGRKNKYGNYNSFDDNYTQTNAWLKYYRNTPTFE